MEARLLTWASGGLKGVGTADGELVGAMVGGESIAWLWIPQIFERAP
jgi:hypothetical protein